MNTIIFNIRIVDSKIDTDTPDGALYIANGKIANIKYATGTTDPDALQMLLKASADCTFIDAGGCVVMPSFIDMHAHFRDPGQTEKETLETGCNAAAAGGFGTVVLMPNTVPVISTAEQAQEIRERAAAIGKVTVYQSVSLTRAFGGTDTSHLGMLNAAEIPVATEDGREVASAAVMRDAMIQCKKNNIIVSCHCEDPEFALRAKPYRADALNGIDTVKNIQNAEHLLRLAENTATIRNLQIAVDTGCHIHVAHISTKEAIDAVRIMKEHYRDSLITCEATPHHLCLTEKLPEIVNPPLRFESDRQALIQGIRDGIVNCIATDHAPHTAQDKANGTPGFSGLETAFAACYTKLVMTGDITLTQLCACMTRNPADILGLKAKGRIEQGADADLVFIDLNKQWTVDPEMFASKGKYTPIAGTVLTGKVVRTIREGTTVYSAL